MLVNKHINADAERQHEHARDLAQNARRKRPDRVVEPVHVAAHGEAKAEFRRHQDDEDRDGVDDDVQAAAPEGSVK